MTGQKKGTPLKLVSPVSGDASVARFNRKETIQASEECEMRQIRAIDESTTAEGSATLQSNQPPRLSEHMGWAPLIHGTRNCQFLHDSLTVDQDLAPH